MVVQHNLTAMNSNRMLGITTGQQAKSSEKLSSGYKINRAADDAAGLTISEKMRSQIRGLNKATRKDSGGCIPHSERMKPL
jgi:flagellin